MIIKWDDLMNIAYSSLSFVAPNAEGIFNVGDILKFDENGYGWWIGLVINVRKDRKGIPIHERPEVRNQKYILENTKLAHGFWVKVK